LSYYVRRMRQEDIAQVAQIDREAFSTMWPPANYRSELDNRLAHYIVACDDSKTVELPEPKTAPETGFWGLASKVRRVFNHDRFFGEALPPSGSEYVVGFTGIWVMAQEAHITNIAVRQAYQRQGIGELLIILILDMATELHLRFVTLEVRVSNTVAQSLYRKHGFSQVGVRHGYYTDNHEDGVLMSTADIRLDTFQAQLQQLKQAHSRKWGIPLYEIVD